MKSRNRQLVIVEILGLLLGLLWLSPFYLMIVNAFKTKKEIFSGVLGIPETWTFDNFVQAFIDLDFLRSLFNSVLITVDRKSTRLNSSHVAISYAVFCLKKKNKHNSKT